MVRVEKARANHPAVIGGGPRIEDEKRRHLPFECFSSSLANTLSVT